jgi:hypothetical protein
VVGGSPAPRGCLPALAAAAALVACEPPPALEREAPPPSRELLRLEAPDLCELAVRELYREPALPGAPRLEARRVEVLGRARAAGVVFVRAPRAERGGAGRVERLRARLLEAEQPASVLLELLRATEHDLAARRAALLREGYLYAEEPLLALRLCQVLRLDHLYDAPVVRVERGSEVHHAFRHAGRYYRPPEGEAEPAPSAPVRVEPARWREASLLLFDRVAAAEEPVLRPLHVDLSALRAELGFSAASVERFTEGAAVLTLRTLPRDRPGVAASPSAALESTAVVRFEGSSARLECETWPRGSEAALGDARAAALEARRLSEPVLTAARDMARRALPFDEPRTEEGQQDGLLRVAFREAYERYRETYEFNGDRYFVFDGLGRPRVPQVCIDFITDSLESATGGHWAARGERREFRRGALDFDALGIENPRSVEQFSAFAEEQPEWFDVHLPGPGERVKFYRRREFFESLAASAWRYREGDVVLIYGLRDDERFHYHSFFVAEVDPLTGAPTLLAANAGPAQLRTWEGEMSAAPRREIVARIRPRAELLARAYAQAAEQPGVPLTPPARTLPAASADEPLP